MKRYLLAAMIAGALIISSGAPAASGATSNTRIESAVVKFDEPTKLLGVILKGKYLFLHHEGMMAKGKACTFVYTLDKETEGRLVVSFHCRPVKRDKAEQFKVTVSRQNAFDAPEIQEIQFAGSAEGHQVQQGAQPGGDCYVER
jgi:hypothetical protein